jgi:hypothetical protein
MGNKLIQEDAVNLHNTKKLGGYADAMLYLFANKGVRIARIGWVDRYVEVRILTQDEVDKYCSEWIEADKPTVVMCVEGYPYDYSPSQADYFARNWVALNGGSVALDGGVLNLGIGKVLNLGIGKVLNLNTDNNG